MLSRSLRSLAGLSTNSNSAHSVQESGMHATRQGVVGRAMERVTSGGSASISASAKVGPCTRQQGNSPLGYSFARFPSPFIARTRESERSYVTGTTNGPGRMHKTCEIGTTNRTVMSTLGVCSLGGSPSAPWDSFRLRPCLQACPAPLCPGRVRSACACGFHPRPWQAVPHYIAS